MTGESGSMLDDLQRQVAQTTNAAVEEGKKDVQAAKTTGSEYIDQATSTASGIFTSAQVNSMHISCEDRKSVV